MRVEGKTALAWRRGRYVPLAALTGPRPPPLHFGTASATMDDFVTKDLLDVDYSARARLHVFDEAYLLLRPGDDGVVLTGDRELVMELGAYSQLNQNEAPIDLGQEPCDEVLENVVVGFDAAYRNYYHWLVNGLGRGHLCAQVAPPGACVLLPDFHQAGDADGWVRGEVLQASMSAALTGVPHRLLAAGLYRCRGLHVLWTRPTAPTDIADFAALYAVFDQMVAAVVQSPPTGRRRRLYYSRGASHDPRLPADGAGALNTLLDRHGFEQMRLEEMSFEAQVSAAAQAQIIVAPHGAGLANLLFSPREAVILELAANVNGETRPRPWYYQLASSRGQRYGAIKVDHPDWMQTLDTALRRCLGRP